MNTFRACKYSIYFQKVIADGLINTCSKKSMFFD